MRLLLLFLAIPGSGALVLYILCAFVRAVGRWREEDEDRARAQRLSCVQEEELPIPRGQRTVMERPRGMSSYTREARG